MEKEVVELYVQDLKERTELEVLAPCRRLFGRRNVETRVLEGDSVAAALMKYLEESGVRNIVLGSSSMSWIRRVFNFPDVPTTVLKTMPSSCNIFVVSRRKLTMRFASQQTSSSGTQVQSISHKTFALIQKNLNCFSENEKAKVAGQVNSEPYSQAFSNDRASADASGHMSESSWSEGYPLEGNFGNWTPRKDKQRNYDVVGPFKDIPYVVLQSIEESEPSDELVKLRKELQGTQSMYDRACEDLVHANKKIQVLSSECSEEAQKVKDASEREKQFRRTVEEEKAKHLEAIKVVEEARKLFAAEAHARHNAEIVANIASTEKSKIVDSLLSQTKSCRKYSRKEIELATDNFSDAKKIGEGGYGDVYKCTLDHTEVAVKVIRQDSSDRKEEFFREIEILGQLRHPNLVLLLGFCPENWCLVYEYMENGSLEDQLFHSKGKPPLQWFVRFRIIFEVACGLAFLHDTKPEPIVHRDLKPGNILLDKNYVSKIGDVGFAKLISDLVPDGLTAYKETMLAGTLYYMDPEYQRTGTVRPKSDLYALGIITLQLLTGKHPNGLIIDVERALKAGSFSDILDKSLTDWPVPEAEKLATLALRCSQMKCRDRPDLELEVLPELEALINSANASFKSRSLELSIPSHFLCPILQEIMEDPVVAGDGHTYEHRAIQAWLRNHKVSPVTKRKLPHTSIIPNYSLRTAIKEWKSKMALP